MPSIAHLIRSHHFIAMIVLALWLVSLALPAAWFVPIDPASPLDPFSRSGLSFLLLGPIGLFKWQPAWLANLLILGIALSLALRGRPPLWAAVAVAILPLFALAELGTTFEFEHGERSLASFGIGYWLWCLSAALPLIVRLTIDRHDADEH